MNIDTERVILEVELRPCLWNPSDELYKSKDARIKSWEEVCNEVCENYASMSDDDKRHFEETVQRRWRTARDAYVRCRSKKTKPTSGRRFTYVYFEQMHFLERARSATDDSADHNSADAHDAPYHFQHFTKTELAVCDREDSDTPPEEPRCAPPVDSSSNIQPKRVLKRKRNEKDADFDKDMLRAMVQNVELINNDDVCFFHSLTPILSKFDDSQKILFRIEVLKSAMRIREMNTDEINPLDT